MSLMDALARFYSLPQWGRLVLYGALAILLSAGLLTWFFNVHDAALIDQHEAKTEAVASEARDRSAEERADDALINLINEKDRENAIQSAPTGGAVSDADLRLNCLRLAKLGRTPEPCRRFSAN